MINTPIRGPGMFPVEETRASVLGEFGGLGWPVEDHLWWNKRNWGYRTYDSRDKLALEYEGLIFTLRTLIPQGLAAAVYTQTTDVEGEINGLMTYDRELVKIGLDVLATINNKVYGAPLQMQVLVPTSEEEGQPWRYTVTDPGKGWRSSDFDDSSWKEGLGVLGTKGTPSANIRTVWTPATSGQEEPLNCRNSSMATSGFMCITMKTPKFISTAPAQQNLKATLPPTPP